MSFEIFWKEGLPKAMRNGKKDARTAYEKCRKGLNCEHPLSHDEIMNRLRVWLATREEWYTLCWAQKFLNQYIDDVEGETVPAEQETLEWWRARCDDALSSKFMWDQFFNNYSSLPIPPEIREEYPQMFSERRPDFPKLRVV